MPGVASRRLPPPIRMVLYLLIAKAVFACIEFIVPYAVPDHPLPFMPGVLVFAVPGILIPLALLLVFKRAPAVGYWGAIAFAPLSILINLALIVAPYMLTVPIPYPDPDPVAPARALETAGRIGASLLSLILLLVTVKRPVRTWVTGREEALLTIRYPSRRTPSLAERGSWVVPVVVGILTPPLIWIVVAMAVGGRGFGDALLDVLLEHIRGRAFMHGLFSLLPFVVLASISYYNAGRIPSFTLWAVTLGGIVGILALLIPAYSIAWITLYNDVVGDEKSRGALVFFFTPLFGLATMLGGMLVGWVTARIIRRGVDDIIDDH